MILVADTNTFLAVALEEPEKSWLVEATRGAELAAPAVLPFEVGNALSAMVKRGRLAVAEALEAWDVIAKLPFRCIEVDGRGAVELAAKWKIYAYDAYFLQCARQLACPLLTLDRGMSRIARKLDIGLLEKP
jgi:predicted nucleic acid-binding protein